MTSRGCPAEEALTLLAEGSAPAESRAALVAHVEGCAACRQLVGVLLRSAATPSLAQTLPSVPAEPALEPGLKLGPYLVVRLLGAGAMGAVYAAWDGRLEREVALKVLHREADDVLAEARALAKLSHPNVVTVHEVAAWHSRVVLVMELARGTTLRAWLALEPRSQREVLQVLLQCADGLGAAHAAGVVHRDFKPDNVLVDDAGHARLLDFGLAATGAATMPGRLLVGTPAYLPLAQLEGAPGDARADQFAWWVSLFEALTGRRPFVGKTIDELRAALRQGVTSWAGVPRWLRPLVMSGLDLDPGARFKSMAAAAAAVRRGPRAQRVAALVTVSLLAVGGAAYALTPASACGPVHRQALALLQRAPEGPLRTAAQALVQQANACEALPPDARGRRAACLDTSARELGITLDAVAGLTDVPIELHPRALRRVLAPARCADATMPQAPRPADAELAALVQSVREHLRFDLHRRDGHIEDALKVARAEKRAADASGVAAARAWARLNEATGESILGKSTQTLQLLREVEGLPGVAPREEATAVVGRYLFKCFYDDGQTCDTVGARARRLVAELDEPWTRAHLLEVTATVEQTSLDAATAAWKEIPGAEAEQRRVVLAELMAAQRDDDAPRRLRALARARELPLLEVLERVNFSFLEATVAAANEDVAGLEAVLKRLQAEAPTPFTETSARAVQQLLLYASNRLPEALALIDDTLARGTSTNEERHRLLLNRLEVLMWLDDEASYRRADAIFTTLLEEHLTERGLEGLSAIRLQHALRLGDGAALRREAHPEALEGPFMQWQLATIEGRHDDARRLLDAADANQDDQDDDQDDDSWERRALHVEALLSRAQWREAMLEATRLHDEARRGVDKMRARARLAWAHWQLGERVEACRAHALASMRHWVIPLELVRAKTVEAGCSVAGAPSQK